MLLIFWKKNSVTYLDNFTGNRYQTTLHQRRYNQCWKWKPWRVPFYQGTLCNYVYISSVDHTTSKLKTYSSLWNSPPDQYFSEISFSCTTRNLFVKRIWWKPENRSFIALWDELSIQYSQLLTNKDQTALLIWVSLTPGSG